MKSSYSDRPGRSLSASVQRILLLAVLAHLCLFIPSAMAISFDLWETGITRQQMMEIAARNALSLQLRGESSPDATTSAPADPEKALAFSYPTTLYETPATMNLDFSKGGGEDARLFRIEAVFSDPEKNRRLVPYLVSKLTATYGRGETRKNFWQKELIIHPLPGSEIRLIHNADQLKLRYTDLKLEGTASF